MECRLVWPVGAALGEGPAWIADDAALWFVDIKGGNLHRYCPATDERRTYHVGGNPSFVVPTDAGQLLVGNRNGLSLFDGHALTAPLVRIDMPRHNRTNDATVDAAGRLWFGTMDDEEQRPTGAFHRLDGSQIKVAGGECIVTNGPAFTCDAEHIYHVNSAERIVWRSRLSPSGRFRDSIPFVTLAPEEGHPDGIVVDSEDCLWVALWDGWGVRRYSSDGILLDTVSLPCARVTKIAFGGPGLRTAFVTTARISLGEGALAGQPEAGGLFAFEAPAAGRLLPAVRLNR